MDGYELTKSLRDANYKVPILLVTAKSAIEDKREGFLLGADDYMENLENNLIIKIKDYGKGMTKEECKRIFDRFYQVDKMHSERGAGLGLTIVKRIIELSKGKIEVESKVDKGTTFIVTLPIMSQVG